MSKGKLSSAEVQLLLSHYQRRLKKAGKKMVSLEKKQAKLQKKIERLLLLQGSKSEETSAGKISTVESPMEAYTPKTSHQLEAKASKTAVEEAVSAKVTRAEVVNEEEEEETFVEHKAKEVDVSEAIKARPKNPSQWHQFVLGVVSRYKRPTLTREIYHEASVEFAFSDVEMLVEERSIAKSLNVLSAKTGDLRKYKEGKMRGFYYCLPEWFYPSGELKKMYYKRIPRNED